MAARKRASIGAPLRKIKNPYRGLFLQVGAFFSLLGPCLGLPLLQNILWESMVVSKQDAVTVTKATQINGASNVIFVYAYRNQKLLHSIPYHIIIDVLNEGMLNDINNIFKCCT